VGGLKDLGKRLEKGGKSLLRGSVVKLLPKPRPPEGPLDPGSVRRVLAVRHDARLGNVLLLTPALRLIKTAFPRARVDVLLADKYGDALKFNPCVDEVLTARSLPGLRRRGYDLAFDFSPQHAFSLSSALWTAASGAKRRVGFDRGDAAKFLDDLVPVPAGRAHETANLASLVRHAAPAAALPSDAKLRTEWHFGPGEREKGERTWRGWGLDGESVALFLGARAEKRLPPEWFLELAGHLRAAGRRVVLTGGPAERELLKGLSIPEGVAVAPELPLREFAAAISRARAVLTADTGPMHLCVAAGVPAVELFSHTETWRFGYAHLPGQFVLDSGGRHPSVHEAWSVLSELLAAPRP
jgi:ADP-heptose:LPS heptosyltransferase